MAEPEKTLNVLDVLPLVFKTISDRLELLAEMQKGEAQTKQINRLAAWERLQWTAMVWKMFTEGYLGKGTK